MELDYRAIGKAATDQTINLAGSDWTEEQMQECIGKAAVAAMIPAALDGGCESRCPFLGDFGECSLGWQLRAERVGPACPASKEGKK